MKVLIAGGSGFMGRHLINSLIADSHQVWVLSRSLVKSSLALKLFPGMDRQQLAGEQHMEEMDAVVNLCGTQLFIAGRGQNIKKQRFYDSRVKPGHVLATAIKNASHRPDVFIQISGINHYGLRGEGIADESTPPADDYLAQLTVAWEEATKSVEDVGVRHVVCRTAVVLASDAILMWLMALPVRLFIGGRLWQWGAGYALDSY